MKSGAMVFSRPAGPAGPAGAPAAKIRIDRQAHIAATPNTRSRGATTLSALGDGVTFVDPVGAEIMGNVQCLDIAKAERAQRAEGGADIRAFAPRAAAAVDDDRSLFGQLGDALSQHVKPGAFVARAGILGADDMRLVIKLAESNLQYDRPGVRIRLQDCGKFRRLQ